MTATTPAPILELEDLRTEIKFDGVEYLLLSARDILAIVEK